MDLANLLRIQEQEREDYWKNKDYFLFFRLRWRAQMVRHLFHLFPEDSVLELGAGSCLWTSEISRVSGNRNPICAATFNKELHEKNED